jgi:hypothetical protein
LPIGDSLNGEWGVSLDYGQYQLSWTARPESSTAILSQGTTSINIIQPNLVAIDSVVLLPECDSVGNLIFDIPVRNTSASSFYGNIGLYASFINETRELELDPFAVDTIRFTNNAILSEGHYPLTAKILQNGAPLFEFTDSLYFIPTIFIDSLPQGLTFNIGDTAKIYIKTKNKGTAQGEETLTFEFGEFGKETRFVNLIPGESKTDTFIFYLPEDLEEKTYYASTWLGNEEYILPIQILGYKILVNASLNQPNFIPGDTVILNLNIANQNERNLKGFSVANYNGEAITHNFLLSGYAKNVDLSNPEFIRASGDSGVYVSPVLWLEDFDSIMVRPEGTGTFGFFTRIVEADSAHYSDWYDDSIVGEQAQLIQFKVEFFDTISTLERINLRIFDSLTYRDTVIEEFNPVDLTHELSFPFEPNANLMFYGVYTQSGRGLCLRNIYIFEANDTCNIITDSQVYDMGDTVFATVQSPYAGKLIWSSDFYPCGIISDSLWVDSLHNQFDFILPSELASGSYSIDFNFYINGDTLQEFFSSQLFDVHGYQVVVFECRLDTNEYVPGDSMFIRFKLNSNKSIPLITKLKFSQNYQWYDVLCDTTDADSGFNVIDFAAVVPELERGPAFLSYSFYKDSIFLAYSSEGFMVYLPDSIPPVAQFVEIPENTYNPNMEHTVKIVATDETHIYDTLYYHNGITQTQLTYQTKTGDTLIYKIPSQPRGTNIAYYIALEDSFGNLTRLPEIDYNQFWVLSPLPPSDCETDTVNQNIEVSWRNPAEYLLYSSGYPSEPRTDSIAVRLTPQYFPAELKKINLFIEKTIPDTAAILNLGFYSVNMGMPGIEIYPPETVEVTEEGANWIEVEIDSVPVTDEIFIIVSGEEINFYGDGDKNVYRTLIKGDIWVTDTIFGNLLAHARFSYEPDSMFYRVLREDSLQFVVIADSITDKTFTDSAVSGERRFRYLMQTHYMFPDLNGTSPILTQIYDYTRPVFGDSIVVLEYVSGYLVGCHIFDSIGVAIDSMIYNGIPTTHDSIIDDFYWYTIPIIGQTIAYNFIAMDSAHNYARNPNTGYFYIIPHIPEGFSGHISTDTTWATDILIKGDVWVDSGATLTIEPGVNVKFIHNFDDEHAGIDTTRAEFIVQGNLALLGNDSMYVTFTSDGVQPQIGDWYGIRFENPDSSIGIEYTEIEYAEIGLYYDLNMPFKVKNCRISYCNIGVNSQSKITQIMETEFLNNNQGAVISDGELNMVKRCEFKDNITALILRGAVNSNWSDTACGVKNEIASLFCKAELLAMTDGFKEDELRSTNTNDDGRCQLALIFNNIIVDNDTGIVFANCALGMVRKSDINNNIIGVYITEHAWPILGIKMSGQNSFTIRCDSLDTLKTFAVYNNTENYLLAEGNWWGTNSEDSIAVIIWDYYDDKNLGVVDFKPFRTYEVTLGKGGVQSNSEKTISECSFEIPTIVNKRNVIMTCWVPKQTGAFLEIYDITGRLMKKILLIGPTYLRQYSINFEDLAGGIYFIRFKSDNYCETKKVILIK